MRGNYPQKVLKNESANKKRLPGKRSAGRAAKLRGKKWRLFNGVKHGVSVNSFKPILTSDIDVHSST